MSFTLLLCVLVVLPGAAADRHARRRDIRKPEAEQSKKENGEDTRTEEEARLKFADGAKGRDPNFMLHLGCIAVMAAAAVLVPFFLGQTNRSLSDKGAPPPGGDTEEEVAPQELLLSFEDHELEESWIRECLPKVARKGATMMTVGAGLFFLYRCGTIFDQWNCVGSEAFTSQHLITHAVVFLTLAGMVALAQLYRRTNDMRYYNACLMIFCLSMIAFQSWPFTFDCSDVLQFSKRCKTHLASFNFWHNMHERQDCELQGHTSEQIVMLFLLVLPYIVPSFSIMVFIGWLWLLVGYTSASALSVLVLETHRPGANKAHSLKELVFDTSRLCIALGLACYNKYYIEKIQRREFSHSRALRLSSQKLYSIFAGMVPEHVIGKMLNHQDIADEVPRVTILFILIADFDKFSSTKDPEELLEFLNGYFSKMDAICVKHNVTKIETVGEEYVCCVGVLPADREVDEDPEQGHGPLLERLFSCAGEILELQTHEVEFKMGVQTGQIVAGVIGLKLPRYRLFGDTINTAARMMQKAEPGQCQFGQATFELLPSSVPATPPKEIEMKGKGKVIAYCYDHEMAKGRKQEEAVSVRASQRSASVVRFDEAMAEVCNEHSATKKHFIPGMFPKFEPKIEEEWFCNFHSKVVCKGFELTIDRCLLALVFVSMWEVIYMEYIKAWEEPHKKFYTAVLNEEQTGEMRFSVYLASRGICFKILLGWRFAARTTWFSENGRQVQIGLLLSCMLFAVLLFVSYDAIIVDSSLKMRAEIANLRAPYNQEFSNLFCLAFYMVMSAFPLLFAPSLFFVPLAWAISMCRDFTRLYISRYGCWIFIIASMIASMLAFENEEADRKHFLAERKVKETQGRIEGILNTLMPPLLVEEMRRKPIGPGKAMPSHKYAAATIAQSDLCGFTQLASKATPKEVVEFVSELFGSFDLLAIEFGIYKVETIGDAYIAGMAERPLTESNSPVAVLLFGLAMIKATNAWSDRRKAGVRCRVGINHGECVGGIVGQGMMRYHLFGEFMSCLDTLEATSQEGEAHVNERCKVAIEKDLKKQQREAIDVFGRFEKRHEEFLKTSKGDRHEFEEVGPPGSKTYLIVPNAGLCD